MVRHGPVPKYLTDLGINDWSELHHLGSGTATGIMQIVAGDILEQKRRLSELEEEITRLSRLQITMRHVEWGAMKKPLLPQLRTREYFPMGSEVMVYVEGTSEVPELSMHKGVVTGFSEFQDDYFAIGDSDSLLEGWSAPCKSAQLLPLSDFVYMQAHPAFTKRWYQVVREEQKSSGLAAALGI